MLVNLNTNLQAPGLCESIGLWEFNDISFINATTRKGLKSPKHLKCNYPSYR